MKLGIDRNTERLLAGVLLVLNPWIHLVEKTADLWHCGRFAGFLELKSGIRELALGLVRQILVDDDFS